MDEISLGDINLYDIGNEIQTAGTIWTGKGLSFVTLLPGKDEDLSNLKKLPMELSDWQRFLKQTDILETEIFQQDSSGITKTLLRKTQRQIDAYIQWDIFARDNYTCRYCGRTRIPLTVDHVDLWEDGGATIVANLLTACRNCNKTRGRQKYEAWLNSPDYKQRSNNLSETVKQANQAVVSTLPQLYSLRVTHIRSR